MAMFGSNDVDSVLKQLRDLGHDVIKEDLPGLFRINGSPELTIGQFLQIAENILCNSSFSASPAFVPESPKPRRLVYLASPYSHYSKGRDVAARHTGVVAATLTRLGYDVFSPVVHSHALAVAGNVSYNDPCWDRFNSIMMERADEMVVAMLPGWAVSRGIAAEKRWFFDHGKKISYLPLSIDHSGLVTLDMPATPQEDPWRDSTEGTPEKVAPESTGTWTKSTGAWNSPTFSPGVFFREIPIVPLQPKKFTVVVSVINPNIDNRRVFNIDNRRVFIVDDLQSLPPDEAFPDLMIRRFISGMVSYNARIVLVFSNSQLQELSLEAHHLGNIGSVDRVVCCGLRADAATYVAKSLNSLAIVDTEASVSRHVAEYFPSRLDGVIVADSRQRVAQFPTRLAVLLTQAKYYTHYDPDSPAAGMYRGDISKTLRWLSENMVEPIYTDIVRDERLANFDTKQPKGWLTNAELDYLALKNINPIRKFPTPPHGLLIWGNSCKDGTPINGRWL